MNLVRFTWDCMNTSMRLIVWKERIESGPVGYRISLSIQHSRLCEVNLGSKEYCGVFQVLGPRIGDDHGSVTDQDDHQRVITTRESSCLSPLSRSEPPDAIDGGYFIHARLGFISWCNRRRYDSLFRLTANAVWLCVPFGQHDVRISI